MTSFVHPFFVPLRCIFSSPELYYASPTLSLRIDRVSEVDFGRGSIKWLTYVSVLTDDRSTRFLGESTRIWQYTFVSCTMIYVFPLSYLCECMMLNIGILDLVYGDVWRGIDSSKEGMMGHPFKFVQGFRSTFRSPGLSLVPWVKMNSKGNTQDQRINSSNGRLKL